MPLADTGGCIAVLLQQTRYGQTSLFDQRRIEPIKYTVLQPRPPAVSPRQNSVSRWRADGGRGVRIGETHSLRGQTIHVRSRDLRLGVVATYITVAEIVGENVDYVWVLWLRR